MDPSYQQAMIQALMGQGIAAPGTTGQNATTPYGQAFLTGNMSHLGTNPLASQQAAAAASQQGLNSASALNSGNSTQLAQPTSTFSS